MPAQAASQRPAAMSNPQLRRTDNRILHSTAKRWILSSWGKSRYQKGMIRFRPLLGPSLWFLPGFALLVGLGVWQIQRLHEKEALIASVEAGLHATPVPLSEALN